MTAYPGQTLTQTMLGQLCTALWDSHSRPVVIQPEIEPGSVLTPLALKCSALRPLHNYGAQRSRALFVICSGLNSNRAIQYQASISVELLGFLSPK